MPNLLSQVFGIREAASGRRPQMAEFTGLNYDADSAQGLLVAFPMWEPPGVPILDLGPLGLIGYQQGAAAIRTQDPIFGDVFQGDGTARGYRIPYNKEINFGLGPSPFSISFWYQAVAGYSPGTDRYLLAYDDPATTPIHFAGYAVSFDTGGTIACNTGNNQQGDVAFKTSSGVFDGNWHLLTFSHKPAGIAASTQALNQYFWDGVLLNSRNTCADVGAVGGTINMYIGMDDDGVSQPFQSQFCDLRIYNNALDATSAASLYHPDTRWDAYWYKRKSYFLPPQQAADFVPYNPWPQQGPILAM